MSIPLPKPDAYGSDISRRLSERIRQALVANGGWLSFERYMHYALYDPELGYYHNGSKKFGAEGDFVTAPELSVLFAEVLATQVAEVLTQLDDPVILEIGAGTGRLAEDLNVALRAQSVSARYWVLEPSAELRARQQAHLSASEVEIQWLEQLPSEPLQGLILANEVLDAFPTVCFIKQGGKARPLGVVWENDGFTWASGEPEKGLSDLIAELETSLGYVLPEGFRSEISPTIPAWIQSISSTLEKGAVLTIDYGLTEREYYHPQRNQGTLLCHYRHRAHADPFLLPGLQDISAWVDFSACARAAKNAGLNVAGFTTQGQFLIHGGVAERLGRLDGVTAFRAAQALKTLVLPGEMGERFKLLLLSRGLQLDPLPGRDFRDRL